MNERIEMLKKMVEKSANPVGWIGYHEGHLVSFLQTQEQVNSFLKNTDTAGRVEPVYTHPVEEHFEDEPQAEELHEIMQSNTHPVEEQDESFDRTASHMAGEYVSYPIKELTLTDDEVMDLWNQAFSHPADFARAILLKAQE